MEVFDGPGKSVGRRFGLFVRTRALTGFGSPGENELGRQPVEELGMAWFGAHLAEVVGGGDEAGAKMLLPDAIDQDACRQRLALAHDPACQGQTASFRGGGQRRLSV